VSLIERSSLYSFPLLEEEIDQQLNKDAKEIILSSEAK
jgi:hypothetical protein